MKYIILLLLSSCSLFGAAANYRIPIYSGYDLLSGQASGSVTTNVSTLVPYLNGYWYQSNYTGVTYWQIPAQQLYRSGASNFVISFNILATNTAFDGFLNLLAAYARLRIYTNIPLLNPYVAGTPTNIVAAYYDSGDKTILGTFSPGTNIHYYVLTNSIATNILANTNIAFGIISFDHQYVAGSRGSMWLLNGRLNLKP